MISPTTRLVALLGSPVAHSLSPRMHNAAFAATGLDWAYVACEVLPDRLEDAIHGLAALGFAGANVTAPHKVAAAQVVESDAPSVNTLVFNGRHPRGTTTDAAILDGLQTDGALVIGDGGSARSFVDALPNARVYSRRGAWPPDASEANLVINATPVRDEVLVQLRAGQTLVDLPYPETATAAAARASGARVIGGLEVLVAQGAAAFQLWTGVPAPVRVMRAAVGLSP